MYDVIIYIIVDDVQILFLPSEKFTFKRK